MKATILSHAAIPDGPDQSELHRFGYCLDDGEHVPHVESVSLRTARMLVKELEDGNAFVKMLCLIVRTDPPSYDSIIGHSFSDSFSEQSDSKQA
jgi:hypothetical protein